MTRAPTRRSCTRPGISSPAASPSSCSWPRTSPGTAATSASPARSPRCCARSTGWRPRPAAHPAALPVPVGGPRPARRHDARAAHGRALLRPVVAARIATVARRDEAVGRRRPLPRGHRRHPRPASPTPRSGRRSSSASPARPTTTTTGSSSSCTPPSSTGPGSSRSAGRTAPPRPRSRAPRRPSSSPSGSPSCGELQDAITAAAPRRRSSAREVEVLVDAVDGPGLVGRTFREAPEIDGVVRLAGAPGRPGAARAGRRRGGGRPRPRGPPAAPRRPRCGGRVTHGRPGSGATRPTACARRANAVTVARMVLCVPAAARDGRRPGPSWPLLVGWIVLGITDGVDGWLARRDGTTRSGAFLDPLADKFFSAGGFVALAAHGTYAWFPVLLIVGREAVISVLPVVGGPAGHLAARQHARQGQDQRADRRRGLRAGAAARRRRRLHELGLWTATPSRWCRAADRLPRPRRARP